MTGHDKTEHSFPDRAALPPVEAVEVAKNGEVPVEGLLQGKDAVKALLIERLLDAGFARPRGVSVDAFARQQKHLAERLAYMSPENLMTLADVLIGKPVKGHAWPSELMVMQFAAGLQAPPPMQSRIVTSWLASIEGPKAVLRGDLVEIYRYVRRQHAPPQGAYAASRIAEEARDNNRRRIIVQERIRDGVASDEDRRWLREWEADHSAAMALVRAGQEKRGEA